MEAIDIMKKSYVTPVAIKVNFEANDIITASGSLSRSTFEDWNKGIMSVSWNELIGQ